MIANAPALTPGTRVVVVNGGYLSGLHGVVVESPVGVWCDNNIAVRLDKDHGRPNCELGFYAHELAVEE